MYLIFQSFLLNLLNYVRLTGDYIPPLNPISHSRASVYCKVLMHFHGLVCRCSPNRHLLHHYILDKKCDHGSLIASLLDCPCS